MVMACGVRHCCLGRRLSTKIDRVASIYPMNQFQQESEQAMDMEEEEILVKPTRELSFRPC